MQINVKEGEIERSESNHPHLQTKSESSYSPHRGVNLDTLRFDEKKKTELAYEKDRCSNLFLQTSITVRRLKVEFQL